MEGTSTTPHAHTVSLVSLLLAPSSYCIKKAGSTANAAQAPQGIGRTLLLRSRAGVTQPAERHAHLCVDELAARAQLVLLLEAAVDEVQQVHTAGTRLQPAQDHTTKQHTTTHAGSSEPTPPYVAAKQSLHAGAMPFPAPNKTQRSLPPQALPGGPACCHITSSTQTTTK